jgi:hypothetical protein
LNDNQLAYAVWLSFPPEFRIPKTQQLFAASINVSENTLIRWKTLPDVIMASRWLAIQQAGDVGRVSEVLDFLHETAMNHAVGTGFRLSAAREWLKAVGVGDAFRYDNKLLVAVQEEEYDLDSLSDDELYELYEARQRAMMEGRNDEAEAADSDICEAEIVDQSGEEVVGSGS